MHKCSNYDDVYQLIEKGGLKNSQMSQGERMGLEWNRLTVSNNQ